ncbi:Threonine dehydratase [Pseudomonas savastanoi pv. glycinea]|nr:Threonine dehydratase [Pseudomonas savastanoi pv. glycinea]
MRCKALSFVWSSFGTQGRLPDLARFVSDAAPMLEHYVKKILTSRVYDVAVETPLHGARQLSERLGNRVLLKREDLQPVFSFKIRGAYNKLAQLTAEEAARGVVTASAGNHAQGLALAARELGILATIVMPRTTPEIKVEGVRSRGATVVLHGDSFPEALAYSLKLVDEQGFVYIHPYDDPDTIAGQGTVAMEILRQQPGQLDAIFVPVGGGGLIAGIAAYVKYLRPEIKVIGVEPDDSNCLQAAMAAGERVVLSQVGLFADGVAVAQIGHHTFEVCRHYVDEVITVSTDEICAAIKDIYDDTRSIAERLRRAGRGRDQEIRRAARYQRSDTGGDRLRSQRQLRPFASRCRARRAGRRPRGDHRRDHSRAAGQLQGVLRGHRQAADHRIQLPLPHRSRGAHLRRRADSPGERPAQRADHQPDRAGFSGAGPDRQRTGQTAYSPHGWRACRAGQ